MRISDWSSDVCSSDLGNDAFLNGRAGGVKRVVDAILALLHFDFRSAADLDHRNAASKLGETLLQLFTVIVRRSRLDLRADLLDPALDALGVARPIDKGRVVRSEERRVGKECVSKGRTRGSTYT